MTACGPVDSTGRQLLASGIWNANTSLQIRGGQGMHFEITNTVPCPLYKSASYRRQPICDQNTN